MMIMTAPRMRSMEAMREVTGAETGGVGLGMVAIVAGLPNAGILFACLRERKRKGFALVVLHGRLVGGFMHALCVEDESFHFGFGALRGNFLSVPDEGNTCGVSDAGDDFTRGTDRCRGRSDESFVRDRLAVGCNRNPGIFRRADHQGHRGRRFCRRLGRRKGANGYIVGSVFRVGRRWACLLLRWPACSSRRRFCRWRV